MIAAFLLAASIQQPGADTSAARRLDPMVVTAERLPGTLSTSIASVTRLSRAQLASLPRVTIADLVSRAPGISTVDFDGLGFDPQLMVRGFYGGGEAEYVLVLVDGKPVSQVNTGVAAWDVLPPLASVEAIEVVRGSASSLYGDAALGGVINIITRPGSTGARGAIRWEGSGGAYGTLHGGGTASFAGDGSSLQGALDRTDGYREHAGRTAVRGGASVPLSRRAPAARLSLRGHWREFDEPGPLRESKYEADHRASDPIFQFDHTRDWMAGATIEGSLVTQPRRTVTGTAGLELRDLEAVRTLPLAPDVGDSKWRDAFTTRMGAGLQSVLPASALPGRGRVTAGLEASRSSLDSRYYDYASTCCDDFVYPPGRHGDLESDAFSTRAAVAGYLEYSVAAGKALRLVGGGRFDVLHDTFRPTLPEGLPGQTTTHTAFSPRLGANLAYAGGAGHLFATVSRTFKAPTLDQLYDLRAIPLPFPPFSITTSNPRLTPQRGTAVEAGLYHGGRIGASAVGSASVSLYQISMSNELDFDVESFHYINIGKSRHRGAEIELRVESPALSTSVAWALQSAISRSGDDAGRRLKAIPRQALSGGAALRPLPSRERLELSLGVIHQSGMYFDDANTRRIPAFTRLDARMIVRTGGFGFHLSGRNLFDRKYSSSGYLDPSGSGEAYLYPAAGRVLEAGITRGW